MADLYRTNSPSPSIVSEDMSSILHDILRTSANPPPSSGKHKQSCSSPPPPAASSSANLYRRLPNFSYADPRFGEGGREPPVIGPSSGFNFSDPGHGFVNETEAMCAVDFDRIGSTLARKFPLESDNDEFGFDSKDELEMQEVPSGGAPPRSSKRARAAEVHNLSEKRRRSKINEKLKALQSLIPNSNKTDKASMLDEAIEYLKQLQLQVQMLSMRNGVNLHPFSLPGSINRTEFASLGIGFEEQNELLNAKGGDDGLPGGSRDTFLHNAFSLPNQYTPSNQQSITCSIPNIANAETSFGLGPSNQSHNVMSFGHLTSPKEICTGNRLAQMQMDMSCLGGKSFIGRVFLAK